MPQASDPAAVERFRRKMKNSFLMWFFMLTKLPLGLVSGMRLTDVTPERGEVRIRYGWRNTNPFKSMYFAAQAMAAELSTGCLALLATEVAPRSVAMLITGLEAEFGKKATGIVTFVCEDGDKIFAAVAETLETGEAATVRAQTVGRMTDGTEVARFVFTWSFKRRSSNGARP